LVPNDDALVLQQAIITYLTNSALAATHAKQLHTQMTARTLQKMTDQISYLYTSTH
jgi:hypothetical protein